MADASGMDAAAAMDAFASEIAPMIEALSQHLLRPSTGTRITTASNSHTAVATQVSELVRRRPEIGRVGHPDVVDAGLATLAASRRLAVVLKSLLATVEDTGRVGFDSGWQEARLLLKRAESQAKTDKTLAEEIAPIQGISRKGPRSVTSPRVAVNAQQRATAAAARATVAQARADAAHQRAASAQAAAHPAASSAGSSGQGASSAPVANPQGPSASAGVNPQGPARG